MLACNMCVQCGTCGRVGYKMVVRGDGEMITQNAEQFLWSVEPSESSHEKVEEISLVLIFSAVM